MSQPRRPTAEFTLGSRAGPLPRRGAPPSKPTTGSPAGQFPQLQVGTPYSSSPVRELFAAKQRIPHSKSTISSLKFGFVMFSLSSNPPAARLQYRHFG